VFHTKFAAGFAQDTVLRKTGFEFGARRYTGPDNFVLYVR
jgi:hypothetical protein